MFSQGRGAGGITATYSLDAILAAEAAEYSPLMGADGHYVSTTASWWVH